MGAFIQRSIFILILGSDVALFKILIIHADQD